VNQSGYILCKSKRKVKIRRQNRKQVNEISCFDVAEVVKGPSVAGKAERWVPFGEPYQERVVSMLPGSNAPLAFDPYYSPPPPPPQFSPQQYFQPPQPPPAAYAAGTPMILPVIANQEKQEQNSKARVFYLTIPGIFS